MKRIILCADDYGQNAAISQGIIHLIDAKRLSAVSCMTETSCWNQAGPLIKKYKNQVDIGLHLNLTLDKVSLKKVVLQSQFRMLNKTKLVEAFNDQLQRFIDKIESLPDFIDGHQHIHQFPVIRDAVIELYQSRLKNSNCYIRAVGSNERKRDFLKKTNFKQVLINILGASSFKKQLLAYKIPHNASFSGIYPFNKSKQYAHWFDFFLSKITDNGLIMCHPGLSGSMDDPIASARIDEYQFLSSTLYQTLCRKNNVQVVRYNQFKV